MIDNNPKQKLRIKCKEIRKNTEINDTSLGICNIIKNWPVFKSAQNIMLFYPIGSEVSLLNLLKIPDKNYYFPCVDGDNITAARYNPDEGFSKGKYDIMEPVGQRYTDCNFLDLVFVPALAADIKGNRLGYGKGYYDRFLSAHTSIISAVPLSSKLLFSSIPSENHDIKVNYLITQDRIIRP